MLETSAADPINSYIIKYYCISQKTTSIFEVRQKTKSNINLI